MLKQLLFCTVFAQKTGSCAIFSVFFLSLSWQFLNFVILLQQIMFNLQKNTTMSEIESRVKAIIVEKFGVSEAEVTSEANFTNDLSADSLDRVELIMEIEDEFGISIPEDQAEKIATVGDAVKFVEEKVAEK